MSSFFRQTQQLEDADIDIAEEDFMSPDDMLLDPAPVTRERVTDALKIAGETLVDITPVIGDIKAAT